MCRLLSALGQEKPADAETEKPADAEKPAEPEEPQEQEQDAEAISGPKAWRFEPFRDCGAGKRVQHGRMGR